MKTIVLDVSGSLYDESSTALMYAVGRSPDFLERNKVFIVGGEVARVSSTIIWTN